MTDETTTEQLVEIEGQATEYTPPDGWRVLQVGEMLQSGDQVVQLHDGKRLPTVRAGQYVCETQRYIRPIEPEPEPQPQPVQVCEGRWLTRGGDVCYVTKTPDDIRYREGFPWWDASVGYTWRQDGRYLRDEECDVDLVEYLGPIEQSEKTITPDDVAGEAFGGVWNQRQAERTIADLQHRLDVVSAEWAEQTGTINGLQQQLEAVKAELLRVSHDRYQLQIELDAAQQVPADSPELRQLRADLAEVTLDRDQCKDAYTQLFAFVETVRETAKARAVETIAEWTEPFRRCGSERLAWMVMQNLPHIMRSLTGLEDEGIE